MPQAAPRVIRGRGKISCNGPPGRLGRWNIMPLASTIAVCLLSLFAAPMPVHGRLPLVAQASPSGTQQDNSSPQPGGQDASPAQPPAAAEPNSSQSAPSNQAAKPGQASESSPATAPPASPPAAAQESPGAQSPPAAEPAKATPPAPQRKPAKRTTIHRVQKTKPSPATAKPGAPSKVVVKNGSAAEPREQLAPSLSQQQASSQRQGTSQLLANTDQSLKKISGHQLASSQQDMVQQIRKYMEQAKAATDAGDLDRAHNLALKANLLAQELAKP